MIFCKPSRFVVFIFTTFLALSTISTIFAEPCNNDPTFEFRNNPKLNCDWLANNQDSHCERKWKNKELNTYCPESCNMCQAAGKTCSDDPKFKYKKKSWMDCGWVGRSAEKRCAIKWRKIELSNYCPVTCDACPTSADCENDLTLKYRDKKKWNCNWVGRMTKNRCRKPWRGKTLADYCPLACDECPTEAPTGFPTQAPSGSPI